MLVFDNEQKRAVVIDVLIPVDTNIRRRKHWKEPGSPGNNWSRCRRWNPKSRCKNLSSLSNTVQSYQQLRYYAEPSNYSRQGKLYPFALYKLINGNPLEGKGWQSATVFLFSTNQMKRKRPVSQSINTDGILIHTSTQIYNFVWQSTCLPKTAVYCSFQ